MAGALGELVVTPVLSVVSPVFNSGAYLAEALDSVAAMTTPHEHIVFDGGSTDETVEILRRSETVWTSEPDRGQTHAVNKGLGKARGELVAWLNGDDAYVPDAVDRAVALLRSNPSVDAVYGGMVVIDSAGDVRRTYVPDEWSWRRYLFLGDYIPTPTFIFRRRLVEERGPLDERWRDAADYEFYLRLLHGRNVQRVPEPMVRFRWHAESKSASQNDVQQREALEIRLGWARGAADRAAMRGFDALKRQVLPRISPWPNLIADESEARGAGLVRLLDRRRARRNAPGLSSGR